MDTTKLTLVTPAERDLLLRSRKKTLADLDEDALLDLHAAIRRRRTKYVNLHRRQSSAVVAEAGAREQAAEKNVRAATQAELFEEALARVSRRLGKVSRRNAEALRDERIAAARGEPVDAPDSGGQDARQHARRTRSRRAARSKRRAAHLDAPVRSKKNASTRASGKRRQAKKDSR